MRRPQEPRGSPDAVALAKRLARRKPKGGKLSLRAIAASLACEGFLNERGRPYNHKSVASMLAAATPSCFVIPRAVSLPRG
jgi:hypothetical protein